MLQKIYNLSGRYNMKFLLVPVRTRGCDLFSDDFLAHNSLRVPSAGGRETGHPGPNQRVVRPEVPPLWYRITVPVVDLYCGNLLTFLRGGSLLEDEIFGCRVYTFDVDGLL